MKNLNVKLLSLIIIAINSSHITAGDSVTPFFYVGALIFTAGAINPQLAVGPSGNKLIGKPALTDKKKTHNGFPKNKRGQRGRFDKRAAGW